MADEADKITNNTQSLTNNTQSLTNNAQSLTNGAQLVTSEVQSSANKTQVLTNDTQARTDTTQNRTNRIQRLTVVLISLNTLFVCIMGTINIVTLRRGQEGQTRQIDRLRDDFGVQLQHRTIVLDGTFTEMQNKIDNMNAVLQSLEAKVKSTDKTTTRPSLK